MNRRGITLIALIITVIILLILAGTAISISINGSNIFEKTSEARDEWNLKTKIEDATINNYLTYADDYTVVAWDGDIGGSFARGTGTEEDPYIIEDGKQLAYFAKTVNDGNTYNGKYVSIVQTINLGMQEFTPIAKNSYSKYFNGFLDGNGNSITGIKVNLGSTAVIGFIGRLEENGIVKNLKIGNGEITGKNNVGGLVGENKGTIINCSNHATITSLNYQAGGIVGCNLEKGKIIDCTNTGKVVATIANAGGIAGSNFISDSDINKRAEIINCFNAGEISANEQAGGIAGSLGKSIINKCNNTGKIYTTSSNMSGGIVSYAESGEISECNNYGAVYSKSSKAGGIVGEIDSAEINNCSNNGEIEAENNYVGGIVGILNGNAGKLSNLYNEGKVISKSNKTVGGIAGIQTNGTIEHVYNSGEIIGGIKGGVCGVKAGR